VRQKQAAIVALESEREQCLNAERQLQTRMRCARRADAAAAAAGGDGAEDGAVSDDVDRTLNEQRPLRRHGYASDDERLLQVH